LSGRVELPKRSALSARLRGEREETRRMSDGEGEVGKATGVVTWGSPHLTPTLSAPGGGEGEDKTAHGVLRRRAEPSFCPWARGGGGVSVADAAGCGGASVTLAPSRSRSVPSITTLSPGSSPDRIAMR